MAKANDDFSAAIAKATGRADSGDGGQKGTQ